MKKTNFFAALLLAGIAALTFSACGNDTINDENTPPTGSSDSSTDSASAETNPQTEKSDESESEGGSESGENSGSGSDKEKKE